MLVESFGTVIVATAGIYSFDGYRNFGIGEIAAREEELNSQRVNVEKGHRASRRKRKEKSEVEKAFWELGSTPYYQITSFAFLFSVSSDCPFCLPFSISLSLSSLSSSYLSLMRIFRVLLLARVT